MRYDWRHHIYNTMLSADDIKSAKRYWILQIVFHSIYPDCSDKLAWANSVEPNRTPHNAASDQVLHC